MKRGYVYALETNDGVFYVGSTDEPRRRERQHRAMLRRDFRFVVIATFAGRDLAYKFEAQLIRDWKPALNDSYGPLALDRWLKAQERSKAAERGAA